ncbi:hypothetical protein ASG84_12645 [Rhodococcus sp. Leaf278]|uniref:hypothetical protein n=1 Tax=Rhodococcus sp. Leaf278 TaxID=1736319 RepID=UPI00070CBEDE|nr:hypothetical protein [Rhodococcus sp. Leaf278]KQU45083.1 hypothetical protein ASG84_12645 [Rhodococcus sp. Leaf278]
MIAMPFTLRQNDRVVSGIAIALAIGIGAVIAPAAVGGEYVIAAIVGVLLILASAAHPKFAVLLWLLSACFLPFWVGVDNPFYLPASSLAGFLVLCGAFVRNPWRIGRVDTAVLLFCALCLVCGVVGLSRPGDVTNVMTQWLLSFVVGRLLVQRAGLPFTYRAIAYIFSAAALCSMVEFFFDWNPYYGWVVDNTQYLAWGHEQDRGGIVRAEWAFGHSIALGCALAMAIPIVFNCNFKSVIRASLIAVLLGGAVVSFSRSGMISAVFALLLSLLFFSDKEKTRGRLAVVFTLGAIAWFAIPKILSVFAEEGRRATISADYRLTLIDLIPSMNPLGLANGYTEPNRGEFYFQGFKSIDSTFVLLGVSFGFIVALLALGGVGWLTWRVVRRTSSAPAISVLAVVPALFTVALITQFGSIFWFFLGILSLHDRLNPDRRVNAEGQGDSPLVDARLTETKSTAISNKIGLVKDV